MEVKFKVQKINQEFRSDNELREIAAYFESKWQKLQKEVEENETVVKKVNAKIV